MTLNVVFSLSPPLQRLLEKSIVATLADFTVKLDKIEADIAAHNASDAVVVTALNAEIADLKAKLAAGGLTADEEAVVLARLDAIDVRVNPTPA